MYWAHRAGPAIAAVVFAVLYTAALFGVMDLAEGADSDAAVRAALADSGERAGVIAGVYLLAGAEWRSCGSSRRSGGSLSAPSHTNAQRIHPAGARIERSREAAAPPFLPSDLGRRTTASPNASAVPRCHRRHRATAS